MAVENRGHESYELEEDTKSTGICHTFDTIIVMPAPNQPLQTPSKGKNRLVKLYPLKMPGKVLTTGFIFYLKPLIHVILFRLSSIGPAFSVEVYSVSFVD